MFRMILTASVAGLLVAAPVGLAQAVDAHHPEQSKAKDKPAKKVVKKKKAVTASHSGQMMPMGRMKMSGMKMGGAMMQKGHGAQAGKGGMMQCPMMSAGGMSMSPMMQWHHSMMMWHHQMMHGQSPMHRGG
jgi:hypothetical protein